MSIPISQFIPLPHLSPPWCPYVCSLPLCLYFCFANKIIYTTFHVDGLILCVCHLLLDHTLTSGVLKPVYISSQEMIVKYSGILAVFVKPLLTSSWPWRDYLHHGSQHTLHTGGVCLFLTASLSEYYFKSFYEFFCFVLFCPTKISTSFPLKFFSVILTKVLIVQLFFTLYLFLVHIFGWFWLSDKNFYF